MHHPPPYVPNILPIKILVVQKNIGKKHLFQFRTSPLKRNNMKLTPFHPRPRVVPFSLSISKIGQ